MSDRLDTPVLRGNIMARMLDRLQAAMQPRSRSSSEVVPTQTVTEAWESTGSSAWLSPPPERALPRDLDLPLSVYDPGALLAEPLAPARAVRSLVHRPTACLHAEPVDARIRRAA